MKFFVFFVLLFSAVFLEGSVTVLPLTLIVLLIGYLLLEKEWIFLIALGSGLILDTMLFGGIGKTSLFFIIFLCIVSFYGKKYETVSVPFVIGASFVGSVFYLLLMDRGSVFAPAFFVSILAGFVGVALQKMKLKKSDRRFQPV